MAQLSSRAIDQFLDRPRDDFRTYHKLSAAKLDALARKYAVDPERWTKLRRPQRIMLLITLRTRHFAWWADTGVGKTITALSLVQHLQKTGELKRALVLVPRRANKDEWETEIKKHAPGLTYSLLPSSIQQKWQTVDEDDTTMVIETYHGLLLMACELEVNDRGKNKMKPSRRLVQRLIKQFDCLILDESQSAKGASKLPYRICRKLAHNMPTAVALSATPHGRDPTDLWAQMDIIDKGDTLGETLGLFRAVFFNERLDLWGQTKYTFRKDRSKLLNTVLANRSIRFAADQADLPKLVVIRKSVPLPDNLGLVYQRARDSFLAAHGHYRESRNAFLRMRQISSGFLGFIDDESSSRAEVEFPENPKLDLLMGLLESIDPQYKIIVFVEFTWSGLRIMRELQQADIPAVHLYGATKDTKALMRTFNTDRRCRVLVLQNQFGLGLNLQAARYGIFFEAPLSPITRQQCIRRFERQYSAYKTVFQYDLLVRDTLDEKILALLQEGRDLFAELIDGKERL